MPLFLNLLFEPDSYPNAYLIAKIGFDTAENEPCKVCLSAGAAPPIGAAAVDRHAPRRGDDGCAAAAASLPSLPAAPLVFQYVPVKSLPTKSAEERLTS